MASQAKSDKKKTPPQSPQAAVPLMATEKDVRVRVFKGHEGHIWRVAMPDDGSFVLTSGEDGTLRLWDLEQKDVHGMVMANEITALLGVAVTGDGKYAASSNANGDIRFFDLSKDQPLNSWKAHHVTEGVGGIIFLDQGKQLVSAGDESWISGWRCDTGERIWPIRKEVRQERHFQNVAASTNGSRIVGSAISEGLMVFSDNGESWVFLHEEVAASAPVSVTGSGRFAWTGTDIGQVVCWDLDEVRRVAALEGHEGPVYAVAVRPDGRFVVSGSADHTVRLWAAETGQCLAVLSGHLRQITHIAITPDGRRIASVSTDRTLRVWDIPDHILARADTSEKRGYMNAKIVLVGDSGVGKSGLALRLWHDRWNATESTHGMEIQRLVLPGTDTDPLVQREIWLWDLAGQPDYRLTHQLFMDQTSLALLVFDPQDERLYDTISYWQHALGKVAHTERLPNILVAARCDRPGLRITLDEIRAWAAERQLHGPILTAAKLKDHPGITELRALMEQLLPWDKMEFRSTPAVFSALKDAILSVRDLTTNTASQGGVIVTPAQLEARVRQAVPHLTFTSGDLRAVTLLLSGEGVLNTLPYGDLVVLKPEWLNCYAGTLVQMAGEDKDHLGHVPLARIEAGKLPHKDGTPRLTHEDEQQLLPALIDLFLKRALTWKQDTPQGPMLVFPSYVRRPRPEAPPRPGRTVIYRFTGPLEEIYSTLVVRLHYSGLFAKTQLYRQAVDYTTATGKLAALTMHAHSERGELEIYFGSGLDGDVQAVFQRFVHDHLTHKAANLERLRNYSCPKCKEEVRDRHVIDTALERKREKLICAYCDPDDKPGIIQLNDVLEQQFANSSLGEELTNKYKRRADEGITAASKESLMIGEVQAIVSSADQIYRTLAQPDVGIDGEIEFRNADKHATNLKYSVQLKSGDSHLRKLLDGTEKFAMEPHYEELWRAKPDTPPVLLIIRTSDKRLRFINATDAIRHARQENPGKPVTNLSFKDANDFTQEAVLRLRNERLGK